MDGKTLATLNSKIFKMVKCPMCEKYPNRYGRKQIKPTIRFYGFRWNIEIATWEIQGYCVLCAKEWRIVISVDHVTGLHFTIVDPKLGKKKGKIGPIEDHLRRNII